MTLEQLARQGRHVGMAEISALEGDNLRRIRKANIKAAFLGEESLRHRCEFVDNIEKVPYIDDANATSFDATWFSFEKLNRKTIWIVGNTTNEAVDEMMPMVQRYVSGIVCLGKNLDIHAVYDNVLKDKIVDVADLTDALYVATIMAKNGETVMYSPACSGCPSGEDFCKEVKKMK